MASPTFGRRRGGSTDCQAMPLARLRSQRPGDDVLARIARTVLLSSLGVAKFSSAGFGVLAPDKPKPRCPCARAVSRSTTAIRPARRAVSSSPDVRSKQASLADVSVIWRQDSNASNCVGVRVCALTAWHEAALANAAIPQQLATILINAALSCMICHSPIGIRLSSIAQGVA